MKRLAAVLILVLAAEAAAEEASVLEKEILVTATRLAREISATGASVSIVTDRDWESRRVRSVAEAIRPVPGAFVSMGGPPGASTSLFLRGAASNQTVVLLDGVQVNDPTIGGQFNFFDLGLDNVSRIEVLRGAASTLYGSDALGGVVNVVTRRGRGAPAYTAELEGGSFGHYRMAVSGAGSHEALDFAGAVSRVRYGNDIPHNEFSANTYSASLGFDLSEEMRLTAVGRYVDAEAEDPYDFPFGPQIEKDANILRQRNTGLLGLALEHEATDSFSWSLSASLFKANSLLTNGPDKPGDPPELRSRALAAVRTLSATGTYSLDELAEWVGVTGLIGLEYEDEISENRVESAFGAMPELDDTVRNRAAFALVEVVLLDRLTVSGGLRRDRNSFFGWETTTSASVLWRLPETGTRLRANYGEGFRGPKPVEFADPFVGNPDLGPEKSAGFDAGVEQDLLDGVVTIGATWFQLKTRDLIAYDAAAFRLENFTRTRVRGLELSGTVRPAESVTVRGYLTLQNPRNLVAAPGEESRLPGRPKRFGGGEIRYERKGLELGLEAYASGDYPGSGKITPDGTHRDHPGRKLLVGVRGAVEVSPGVWASLSVDNLLNDVWYDSELGPDGLGRGVRIGLSFEF